MKSVRTVLALAMSLILTASLAAQEKERPPRPTEQRRPGAGLFPGIELTAEQQAKMDELQNEFAPKMKDLWQKMEDILSDEQRQARGEAFKAGREAGKSREEVQKAVDEAMKVTDEQKAKMSEVRKEMGKLQEQLREKATGLLTPAQKEKLPKRGPPPFAGADMLRGIELTADQKTKLEELHKEFEPKVRELGQKMEGILTDQQRKARDEAMKAGREAGKEWREIRSAAEAAAKITDEQRAKMNDLSAEMGKVHRELREKAMELLTPAQKEQLQKAQEQRLGGGPPGPAFDPSTLKPLTEGGLYLEKFEMGLYPGGKNEMPEAHRRAGEQIAGTIRPLDASGKPDERDGRIVAVVFGHSNCAMYFSALGRHLQQQRAQLHPRFEMLNAAIGGNQLPEISRLQGSVWEKAEKMVDRSGYSLAQVQVLFLHTTYHGASNGRGAPPRPFPETMKQMQQDLAKVLHHAVEVFPNLKIAYLTCDGFRHYTRFEPHVYQEGFAFKWLIESQIKGEEGTAFEGPNRKLPWLTWGPYIWDNTWDRSYFTDGVHPARKAQEIFVNKYWQHLQNDSVAKPWLLAPASR